MVGLVLRSATRRTGQFFVRLFHRLTGRHEGYRQARRVPLASRQVCR